MSKAAILEDEGTENSANDYQDWQKEGMDVFNANPGSPKAGSQSLKLLKILNLRQDCIVHRSLSEEFRWNDFEYCSLWVYRPSGSFDDPSDTLQLRLTQWEYRRGLSQRVYIPIGNLTADTWIQYELTKAMFMGDLERDRDDFVRGMEWHITKDSGEIDDSIYVDGLDIKYYSYGSLPAPIVLLVLTLVVILGIIISFHTEGLLPSLHKKRDDVKKNIELDIEAIAEKEIQCAFCGENLRITEDMQYCRFCGEIIPRCRICGSSIVHGDEILQCPYCKAYAHKTHFIEWIKVKGYCPVCGTDVEESKDFPAALFDQRITPLSKTFEMISPLDEKNQCSSCGRLITKNVRYCPFCGVKIPQCVVCCLPIMKGEEFVNCPHCGSFAHKNHLIEWVKVKGICPYCRKRLTKSDLPS